MPAPWGASGVAGGEEGSRVKGGRGVSPHAAHWWFSRSRPWTTPVHRVTLGTVTRGTFLSPGWCSCTRKSRSPQGPPRLLRSGFPTPPPGSLRSWRCLRASALLPSPQGHFLPLFAYPHHPSSTNIHPLGRPPSPVQAWNLAAAPLFPRPSLRPSLRPHQPRLPSRGLSASLLQGLPLLWKGILSVCWVWPFMLSAGPRPKQG